MSERSKKINLPTCRHEKNRTLVLYTASGWGYSQSFRLKYASKPTVTRIMIPHTAG